MSNKVLFVVSFLRSMEYNACMSSIGKQNIATLVYDWFMRKKNSSCKENLQSLGFCFVLAKSLVKELRRNCSLSIFFLTVFWDYLNASVFANIVNSYLIQAHFLAILQEKSFLSQFDDCNIRTLRVFSFFGQTKLLAKTKC